MRYPPPVGSGCRRRLKATPRPVETDRGVLSRGLDRFPKGPPPRVNRRQHTNFSRGVIQLAPLCGVQRQHNLDTSRLFQIVSTGPTTEWPFHRFFAFRHFRFSPSNGLGGIGTPDVPPARRAPHNQGNTVLTPVYVWGPLDTHASLAQSKIGPPTQSHSRSIFPGLDTP